MLIDRLARRWTDPTGATAHGVLSVPGSDRTGIGRGWDLGLAEKLALRAVATATGVEPAEVVAAVRETGDLGQAAEQLLAVTAGDRKPSLQVAGSLTHCTRSPAPKGLARRAASSICWPAC